jgi:lipooligosaccharide transport system ATP-binding protein
MSLRLCVSVVITAQHPARGEPPGGAGLAVEALALTKCYGERVAVDAVDLVVPTGEFWGVLGPNGAGKTTFLRMVTGQSPPTAGELRVLGLPVPAAGRLMRYRLGVVPQHDNLDPDFTVEENLRVYGRYFGLRGPVLRGRLSELLSFADLADRADAPIATLSGGMRRRLTLARSLMNTPDLLVLDEPTTGLDPQARRVMWERLRALRARGITLLLTTHYMEEAQRLCEQVVVMDHGRVLVTGSPSDLIARNIEPQVVEVHGPGLEPWHAADGTRLAARSEQAGETRFYYAHDERPLLAALADRPGLTVLHRPANLEDVFLKLTGRELRDG